eukprot:COSAG05_NODE_649_length_8102_cov_157.470823_4_plen_65_part_00
MRPGVRRARKHGPRRGRTPVGGAGAELRCLLRPLCVRCLHVPALRLLSLELLSRDRCFCNLRPY